MICYIKQHTTANAWCSAPCVPGTGIKCNYLQLQLGEPKKSAHMWRTATKLKNECIYGSIEGAYSALRLNNRRSLSTLPSLLNNFDVVSAHLRSEIIQIT